MHGSVLRLPPPAAVSSNIARRARYMTHVLLDMYLDISGNVIT